MSSDNIPVPKKVLIIGCGYAGAAVAQGLDPYKDLIDLTVVTKREHFLLHKHAALRASVAHGGWTKRTMIPLSKLLKNGKVTHGVVKLVDPDGKTAILEDGTVLPWDILVIATGSNNFSPGEPAAHINSKEETEKHFEEMHSALSTTKSVLIVGGGPVGIELAGEILHYGQSGVKATLVTKASHVLAPSAMTSSNVRSLETMLKTNNVDVICNDEVMSVPFPKDTASASPIVNTPAGVDLKSGVHVDCDLLVYAVGSELNTQFLPKEWLDQRSKEVLVDLKTLKSIFREDVYCVGDAAKTNHQKLGYVATADGFTVAKNIVQTAKGKPVTNYVWHPPLAIFIPFGPEKGRIVTPFINFGDYITSMIKGAGLFTAKTWRAIAPGLPRPSL